MYRAWRFSHGPRNAIKHGISVDSAAGRLEIAAQLHNAESLLCVRDDGPARTGIALRFGVGLANVQSRLKQLYGDESSLELTGGDGRGCEPSSPFHCGVRMKTRVLIVDDEPIARRGSVAIWPNTTHEVVGEAANGIVRWSDRFVIDDEDSGLHANSAVEW